MEITKMSVWELREHIEKAMPWWSPLAIVVVSTIFFSLYILWSRR
jgi:hypothetical protein